MMRFETVLTLFPDLRSGELTQWIEQHWVQPEEADGDWSFYEIDVARVRLIYDLRHQLDAPEETISLLLSLLDQVYDLRCNLKTIVDVIDSQPDDIKQAVLDQLKLKNEKKN